MASCVLGAVIDDAGVYRIYTPKCGLSCRRLTLILAVFTDAQSGRDSVSGKALAEMTVSDDDQAQNPELVNEDCE